MASEENFLSRWSRRKRDGEEEPDAEPAPEAVEAQDEEGISEEEANRLAAEAVDLETLRYGDDFSLFLKSGVPELLRRKALRKFFASDPVLANLDGLNDYDEDYNNPAFMVYKSSWDAVKGYLGDARETLREAGERLEEVDRALQAPEPEVQAIEADAPEEVAEASVEEISEAEPEPIAPQRVSLRRRLQG